MAKTKKVEYTDDSGQKVVIKTKYDDNGKVKREDKYEGPGDNHTHKGYEAKTGKQYYAPEKKNRQ